MGQTLGESLELDGIVSPFHGVEDGIREGKGKLRWADGSCYEGHSQSLKDRASGWIEQILARRARARRSHSVPVDRAWSQSLHSVIEVLPDGSWFEASLHIDTAQHNAAELRLSCQGQFHDSELEGHGTFHWPDGPVGVVPAIAER
eukprot:3615365-Amphidinium_carterae.1